MSDWIKENEWPKRHIEDVFVSWVWHDSNGVQGGIDKAFWNERISQWSVAQYGYSEGIQVVFVMAIPELPTKR